MIYSVERADFFIKENSKNDTSLQVDKILKKLFTLNNKRPIIDFLNALYNDDLSYESDINYSNTEVINTKSLTASYITFNADLYITAVDGNDIFEYAIEFQTVFDNEIAIRIFRYSFERALNLNYYRDKNLIKLKFPNPYLILIEEDTGIGDTITLEIEVPETKSFEFNIKVLKYWTYDLSKLYEENKYLLYPLQVFKLRKEMDAIKKNKKSVAQKKLQMITLYERLKVIIFNSISAIDKAYEDGKIEINDYEEMIIVVENLNSYLLNMYGKYGSIEEEVNEMVKSFYDPKVEARGIERGIKVVAENMIKDGDNNEKIKRCTGLNVDEINSLRKVIEIKGEH